VDPDLQADEARRAQRRRVAIRPLERAPTRSHGGRPARPARLRRGRCAASRRAVRGARARRHRSARRRDHRPVRGRDACEHPRAPGRHLPVVGGARSRRRQPDRHRLRDHRRPRRRRDHRRLRGHLAGQPVGHQRRQELHPRLHDVHGTVGPEPRHPEQPRQSRPDQGRGTRRVDRQRPAAPARHRPARGRHVPPQRPAEGARPDPARRRDGGGVGRGVDDAGQREPRRRQPVHHGDVHLRRRGRCPLREAWARCLLVPDGCVGGADRGRGSVGADPVPREVAAARIGRRRPPDGWARPGRRVLRRDLDAVAAERGDEPARRAAPGVFGGEPGAPGAFLVNGEPVRTQARITLQPDDVVRLELPGGGGYGTPDR
jgi:hypothetical protein